MRRPPDETVTFTPEEPSPALAQMDRLAAAHRGWINFVPDVREEDMPDPPVGLASLLAGTVHDIPVGTWVPGKLTRGGVECDTLGLQHNAGTRTAARLRTLGVAVPDGWRPEQDHPRRGLVVRVAAGAGHADQLAWLLEAAAALSTVRLTGTWQATVRLGR